MTTDPLPSSTATQGVRGPFASPLSVLGRVLVMTVLALVELAVIAAAAVLFVLASTGLLFTR